MFVQLFSYHNGSVAQAYPYFNDWRDEVISALFGVGYCYWLVPGTIDPSI